MTTCTVAVEELSELARSALIGGGVPADDAADIADVLIAADLFGIHTHGVQRIPQYLDRVRLGGVNPRPDIRTDALAPAVRLVDGDNGIGPLVGRRALGDALAAGRQTGVGVAFVKGSNHFGPVMPYLYDAAQHGFAAVIASNATTTIAPWGGKATKLGNNPMGWGMPAGDNDPILFDVALSVVARAKIRAAAAAGTKIPTTWATDASGVPTDDPDAALAGFLQPIAGHKGYGLSVMVDLFAGVLSGASYLDRVSSWSSHPEIPQDLGHFFIVIDTETLCPADELDRRVTDFRERLLATPAADPSSPVRLPGQLELQNRRRQQREGVDIAVADLDKLRHLSELRVSAGGTQ
ncbi:Ldh family oxidoreductase [Mycobacterium sp. DSM 3803]|nr:Ldh family oxidoreductase [Mycobacterium sp. DSM 3803]